MWWLFKGSELSSFTGLHLQTFALRPRVNRVDMHALVLLTIPVLIKPLMTLQVTFQIPNEDQWEKGLSYGVRVCITHLRIYITKHTCFCTICTGLTHRHVSIFITCIDLWNITDNFVKLMANQLKLSCIILGTHVHAIITSVTIS